MITNPKKIGILTGGGDCPGLNCVIRAVTKYALEEGYEIIGFKDGFKGLVENNFIKLTNKMVSGILTQGGTILGTSNIANPYKWAKGNKFLDLSKKAILNCKKNKLQALFVVGGDGSMSIAQRLSEDGINIIGIPKTIDNDLPYTDLTFGFNTAVRTATEAIDKIHTTAQSHHRVMVVEVMGRYSGWIALFSGLAGGGDIILIPEIPFEMKNIYKEVNKRNKQGKHFTIIVVAEGAKPRGGELTITKYISTSPDPIRLGGIGMKIANEIEKNTSFESRATILGHVQRGGIPTTFDRILATRFGVESVNLLLKEKFNRMVILKNNKILTVPLNKISNKIKFIPKDFHLIDIARSVGTSFGD